MKNRSLGLKAMIGASALLIFTSPSFADDTNQTPQRRGGISNTIDQRLGDGRGQVSPATPIDAPLPEIVAPVEPAPVAPAQRGQQGNQVAPALPPALEPEILDPAPAVSPSRGQVAPSRGQLPGDLGAPIDAPLADAPLAPGQAVLGDTQPLEPTVAPEQSTQQAVQQEPAKEKKPGFFKRMWTKVKTFFGNVKNKISRKKPAESTITPAPELSPGEGSVGSSPVG